MSPRAKHRQAAADASISSVNRATPPLSSMMQGVVIAWLIGFSVWFYSFGLPNNPPATRSLIWTVLPYDLMDLIDPPRQPGQPAWGWSFLLQRVPFFLVAAFVWCAAWGLGSLVLRALRLRGDSVQKPLAELDTSRHLQPPLAQSLTRTEQTYFALCAGLSLVSLIVLGCGLLANVVDGAMSRWPLMALLGLPLAAEAALMRRDKTRDRTTAAKEQSEVGRLEWIILGAACLFAICLLNGAMTPQNDFDVVEYHLGGPKEWFQQGSISRLPHNVYTSFPFLNEMLVLGGMILWGEWEWGALAGQAVIGGFSIMTALGLFVMGRRWHSPLAGSLAALIWLSTPWAYRITIIAYAEGGLACYLFASLAAVLIWLDHVQPPTTERPSNTDPVHKSSSLGNELDRLPILIGLFAGSAMACKYTGLVSVILPIGIALLVFGGKRRSLVGFAGAGPAVQQQIRNITWFGLGIAITIGPWLIKNAAETGNPVFPLAWSVFGGEGRDAAMESQWQAAHGAKTYPSLTARFVDFFVKLTDVMANNDWHSGLMFAFTPVAFLSFGFLRPERRKATVVGLFVAWQFLSWWLLTHHIDRFYVPMFPAVALLSGVGAASLISAPRIRWLAGGLIIAGCLFNVGIMTRIGGFNAGRTDLAVATQIATPPTLRWLADERDAGRLPPHFKPLCVGEVELFHARFPYAYNTVFDRSLFEEWFFERSRNGELVLRPAGEIHTRLGRAGITHVLVNWSSILRYREPGSYGFPEVAHPDRLAELQAIGVLGPPLPIPAEIALSPVEAGPNEPTSSERDRALQVRREAIEAWAPTLIQSHGGQRGVLLQQVFPVMTPPESNAGFKKNTKPQPDRH